jgi:hypothetical protein
MDESEQLIKSLSRKGALKLLFLFVKREKMKFNDIAQAVNYPSLAGRIIQDFKRFRNFPSYFICSKLDHKELNMVRASSRKSLFGLY